MPHVHFNADGTIAGVYANPQPDALDAEGKVIAKGVPTTELPDDDPRVVAHLAQEK